MTELRQSNIYQINENLITMDDSSTKRIYCSKGMIKCLGIIIFLSSISSFSFYLGVMYQNHLEDKDGSL